MQILGCVLQKDYTSFHYPLLIIQLQNMQYSRPENAMSEPDTCVPFIRTHLPQQYISQLTSPDTLR